MKPRLFALILALTVVSWAQTAIQNAPASAEKPKASCCDKMSSSGGKGGMSCTRHKTADAKDAASCCSGKDAKSCMKDESAASCKEACAKDKSASGCCGDKCSNGGKSCCSDKDEKTANNCCEKNRRS